MKNILHVVSQEGEPIGSINKSCDECGLAIWKFDHYVSKVSDYTKETAKEFKLKRCSDK